MDRNEFGFAEDFGQKVDLTQRIREVLANYPEGTTILKELIQNADDAGASKVSFCLDRRRHGTDSLAYGALAEWQGPALLAFNNATFVEEDFESISRIGDSKKRGQAWKTGRFGVGFNSVYHLSDLPSFVSGKYVVMFDPHCRFLPRVSSANPGKRIDFVSTGALKMYKDQFSPYCAFGCDMESPYSGTLFRFPLRSEVQAAVSKLSRQSYSEEDMQNLLQDLFSEGVPSMLFLKSVEVIEIYEWHANMPEPQQLYTCSVQSPTAEIRWHRQAFTRLSRSPVQSNNVGNHNDLYTLDFVSEVLMGPRQGEKRTESFLIAQSMGSAGSRIGALAKNAKDHYDLHLLPWASVAAKVADSGLKAQEGVALDGQAFCFLPLPVKTGLPVHVNGYFELSSNRRDIWYGADMDRGGKLRSDWNKCLLEDVVAQAFSVLLVEASKQLGHVALYDSLWPCGNFVEPWLTMVKRFYTIAAELPSLYTDAGRGRWITPKQALYHDEEFSDADGLASALTAEGFPLVRLSKSLRDTLFRFCVPNPRMVLPSLIRAQFCKSGKHGGLVERSNALVLLEYCLGDVIDDEAGEVLLGLPLIPLANGTLGVFGKRNDADAFLICTDLEYRLLDSLPGTLVDQSISKYLIERLTNIATLSHTNLSRLSGVILVQLLERLLPPDWKGMEDVEWKPGSNPGHPHEEWLKLLWQHLQQNCKDLSIFKEWPLLPTTSGRLCKLQIHSKIIRAGAWSPSLESLLIKVGCRILRSDLGIEHPRLSTYVHDGSAAGIVDTIFSVTSQELQQLARAFETLDAVERRELREYLYDAKWYAGNEMNEDRLLVLRSFPIFEVYSRTDVKTKINVDLVRSKSFLAPLGVNESLLSPEFLCTYSDRELEWLAGPLKVKRLERPIFYKWRVLNRLHEITPELRNSMMLSILKELPQLAAADSSFLEALKQLAFVPTASGTLQIPKTLYDPRSPELTALLDDQDFFPAGIFLSDEALQMLQGLGLRVAVSPETILQSARQVEALLSNDAGRAHRKGQELLSYLELNAVRWLPQRPLDDKSLGRMFQKVSTIFQSPDSASDETLSRFWHELANVSWCPVLMHPPHPLLPWPSAGSSVAPPKHVALKDDMWLVSASMRILDGECSRSSVLASKLGWSARQSGRRLAAQLLELGKNHVVVQDLVLGQALATVVPRIYTLLNEMLGSDEVEIVKAVLEGSRWVWVGDGFANVQEVAFSGPLHLAPFLRIIPADLAAFKELLLELGVRETLTPNEFALVLSNMAKDKQGAPLDPQQLSAAVWLVQHLADLHFNLQEVVAFVPDANSVLVPAPELVYNDAPWLHNSEGSVAGSLTRPTKSVRGPRFVHAKISTDVADRLGVRSLRRMLLAESADSMDLGLHDAAEAFGQHEALTTRLKHIVEMYSDGPGILCELVQNADDAGAKEVNFLLDRSEFGTSSVLSPSMANWQGPALYCQNDSVFTSRDLYAISRIGQDSKLEKPSAIGRFGLGFNSVYHFTDIPGFISGSNLVMFDPHACNLPGVTPSHPGLKISFVGRGLLEQFPDQLRPYLIFGCDLQRPYSGTLFRFPLRTEKTAANSEIKQEAYTPEDVVALFWSFKSSAEEAILFLRNVASVSVYVRDSPDEDMELLYQVKRPVTTMQSPVYEFVRGNPQYPTDKEQFYRKLTKTPSAQLPWQCQTIEVSLTMDGVQQSQKWLISSAMGGGRARDQAIAPENRPRGFIPWAGIAAPLNINQPKDAVIKNGDEIQDIQLADKTGSSETKGQFEGRAFCFLPLPVKIGLPVHVNGYFELSSNRRDIWYGDDMAGGGKLRANWNRCLLEDVAAPAYARLLVEAARELGATARFHSLWPTGSVHEPWFSLLKQVYMSVVDLDLPVVYTKAAQGKWVSPKRAVFPDSSFSEARELGDALAFAGLPIISAPDSVIAKFREVCPYLRHLTPSMLRRSIAGTRRTLEGSKANVLALKYCFSDMDIEETDAGEKLQGLSLVPLCNGSLATIAIAGAGERIIVATEEETQLLNSAVPYMLVDCGIDNDVFEMLRKIAQRGGTNLTTLTGQVLEELLPRLVPAEWRSKGVVTWVPGDGVYPSLEWMQLLWKFLNSSCGDLSVFEEWPLLPTSDGHLIRLVKNSRVIRDEGWSENMVGVLQKAGCAMSRSDLQVQHPTLGEYVHDASAFGILDSLRAAGGGNLQSLAHALRNASDGELRELRSFLCQSKWFASGKLTASHTEVLRSLPVFESYSRSGRRFTDLPHGKRFFAPDGVSEELLGESFIRAESQKEEEVLAGYLDVTKLTRAVFYRDHLFSNMARIPMAVTTRAMLAVIQDYSKFVEEDPALVSIMSGLPFVLTAQGTLDAPERLYDPRVPELQTLLNKDAFFPSGDFAADAVLDILMELGLKRSLGHSGLLDSARSVAMISNQNPSEAVHRAKALLAHLDDLRIAHESHGESSVDRLLDSRAGDPLTNVEVKDDGIDSEFWLQLANISWCPVLTSSPNDRVPWQPVISPIAAPKLVRPKSQMWLVSATMFILDGECRSASLAAKLGWEEHPNATVLAAQLVALSKQHAKWQTNLVNEAETLQEINATLNKEIPPIYKFLQDEVGTKDLTHVREVLAGIPWVWVGEGFVFPKQLAFDSPAHFHPYLHIVPSEIVGFRTLLTTFGVREMFEAVDYVGVLLRIYQDMNGGALAQEQLTFCLRVLEALSEVIPLNGESHVILGSVMMPDDSRILALAKDLIYNDAPWLAKSASGMIGMRRFVHPDIDNELAERLGVKSLRYLSLVDQEMTSTLPCPDISTISDRLSKENRNLLMFDLLEIADCCKARKVHFMYDKREHPRQSLLQPNLGSFQGPALTIAFEGAVLSKEEVCSLQTSLPTKLRGQFCQYGTGLLGAYHVTELLFIVSSGCLYLFDPPGQVLAASPSDGQASASGGMPVGKAFALKGTDLALRFSDQFRPFQVSSSLSWSSSDSTILRLPLRSVEQAADAKFKDAEEIRDTDIASILDNFKSRASSALLFLKTVEDVSVTVWEEGEAAPHGLFAVRVDPARALLRNPFQEKKWRNFKYQLSSIFGGSSSASKVHTIDILLTEEGTQLVDKWLVVQSLGSGRTRDMALDRKYLSYDLTPIAGVAAHMSRNGSIPAVDTDSCVLAPLPIPVLTGLPVTIMGDFMICHGVTRHLFKSLTPPDLSTDRSSSSGSRASAESVAAAWNRELLSCVRDSYIELLQELQRLRLDPSTSRADPPIGRGLDGTYGVLAERAYSFWPRSRALTSMSSDHPGAVEGQCLAEWLIKPIYARLVELPMWQLHGGAMAKATDGMFLLPPGAERQGMAPPATVCDFLKAHYRVFAVPYELTKEMEAAGVSAKELTPKMLRSLLKIPSVAAAVPSVITQVDLLEFCCTDLHTEEQTTPTSHETGQPGNSEMRLNPTEMQSMRSSSRQPTGLQQIISNSRLRSPEVLRSEHSEPRPSSVAPDGRDPLEWISGIGRALADYGAGVIDDISRDHQNASNLASRSDESSTLDRSAVLDLKGLLCPTATNQMSKLGTTELWVGSKEQQDLLPGLASRFVHALCVERTVLADLFHDPVFQNLLKLHPFTSQVLAANLGAVLPKHWIPRRAVAAAAAPWVGWTMSPLTGPTAEWLRMLWKNIDAASSEELALFSQWPLIPAVTSTPVLVRVGQRELVFVPPVPQLTLPIPDEEDDATTEVDVDGSTRGYLELERHHPWLLPLLRNCGVPVFDRRFLDCSIVDACKPPPEKSLPQVVVAIFLALQKAGCLSPSDLAFTPPDCDALFSLFASSTSAGSAAALAYDSEELNLLRLLPIYKTRTGTYVTLDQQVHCIVPPSMFLQPDDDLCLEYRGPSEGGTLYQALGIPELADHEVMARFALPGFESQPEREQERILGYLLNNWSSQKQHANLVAVLSDTKFVKNLAGDPVLYRPSDLMDPESTLLKRIFADESSKFPGGEFSTAGWLAILRVAGLRSGIDPPLLLDCAKKVEELGKVSLQDSELVDDFDSESAGNNGVSSELWTTAGMLIEAMLNNFASIYGTNFCEALGRIAFVPAERGIPSIGGSSGGRKVLAAYSEAVLVKDWPLAWTCAPILARSTVVPPEFSWGAFRLRHPPPLSTVVKHLKMVGRNGGEDILARWPNGKGMRSVEDVFGDVLKYLTSTWDGLSASDKDALKALQFLPVANGTRLAAAGSLFARLGMDLAPFVFELPSAYLAYVDVLTALGMKDSPTFESMRRLLLQLQRTCGYQRLNPNELQAILRILSFICDKNNRVKSMTSHVLPDPAVDAVVPDDSGRLLQAKACVYADSAGASLVGEIDSSRVRFVHPHVTEQLCVELGVRKLSEVIIEELDENRSLEMLDSIGDFTRSSIAERLRSSPFAEAIWAVVQEASDGIPALKLATSKEKLVKTLGFAADGLWFVRRLYTRFLLLPARADVTRRHKKKPVTVSPMDDDNGGDMGHRVFEYVDKEKSRILIAAPSQGVTLPDLLAVVLSRLIGSPISLPVGALFTAPVGADLSALNVLRLGLTANNSAAKNSMANSGVLGMELVGADAAVVQCHPLRPFHAGEIVAWRPDEQGGLRYGRVLHDVRASAGQALYRLEVETGANEIRLLLSSQVLSFKGTAAATMSAASVDSEDDVQDAFSSIKGTLEPVDRIGGDPSRSEATTADVSQAQEPSRGQVAGNVSAGEVVRAVRDMLAAAGLPMGADQTSLLEHSLTLQEQLTAVDTALIEEQRRAETAVKEAEAARTAWTCRVCLTNEVDTIVIPCGHVLCQNCSTAVSRCPFCRRPVTKSQRLYRP